MLGSMRRRGARAGISALAGLLMVLLASQSTLASVSWTAPYGVGSAYSWSFNPGLARSVSSDGTGQLHAVYTTEQIGSVPATDTGPYVGVYSRRGDASATSWGKPKRLNPVDKHGTNVVVAAADEWVYAAWITVPAYFDNYSPSDPRTIEFRANPAHGANVEWRPPVSLTSSGRVGRISIAAADDYVYIAWTDADTGEIKLAVSDDNGVAFDTAVVGTTTSSAGADGYAGSPIVAASGGNVGVGWLADTDSSVSTAISTEHGANPVVTSLTPNSMGYISAAAKDARLAFAYASETAVRVKVWNAGTWEPTRTASTFSSDGTYKRAAFSTSLALYGTSGLAIAWAACTRADCTGGSSRGINVRFRESPANGASWKPTETVASYSASSSRRLNYAPTLVMAGSKTRYVMYNTQSASGSTWRTYIEKGTGKP